MELDNQYIKPLIRCAEGYLMLHITATFYSKGAFQEKRAVRLKLHTGELYVDPKPQQTRRFMYRLSIFVS